MGSTLHILTACDDRTLTTRSRHWPLLVEAVSRAAYAVGTPTRPEGNGPGPKKSYTFESVPKSAIREVVTHAQHWILCH